MFAKYGDTYEVTKEECVGHVQKRLRTALRKYKNDMKGKKLSDGKEVGGKGRLTDKDTDKMQNYYGKAIRGNKGDLKGMQTTIYCNDLNIAFNFAYNFLQRFLCYYS